MTALARLRRASGLSLRALAWRSGLSKTHVHDLERGRHTPRPRTVARLARALGVAAEMLTERRGA